MSLSDYEPSSPGLQEGSGRQGLLASDEAGLLCLGQRAPGAAAAPSRGAADWQAARGTASLRPRQEPGPRGQQRTVRALGLQAELSERPGHRGPDTQALWGAGLPQPRSPPGRRGGSPRGLGLCAGSVREPRRRGKELGGKGRRWHRGQLGDWTRRGGGPTRRQKGPSWGPEARSSPGRRAGGAALTVSRGMLFLPWKDIFQLLGRSRRLVNPRGLARTGRAWGSRRGMQELGLRGTRGAQAGTRGAPGRRPSGSAPGRAAPLLAPPPAPPRPRPAAAPVSKLRPGRAPPGHPEPPLQAQAEATRPALRGPRGRRLLRGEGEAVTGPSPCVCAELHPRRRAREVWPFPIGRPRRPGQPRARHQLLGDQGTRGRRA